MGARVLFRDSQGRDGQVDLSPSAPLYVGRALDCAIRTDDAMVSRKHSMIRMENGRFYVEDLGSSNGTHVNDIRVTKHLLAHNDVVRCGSLWLRYVEDGPLTASPPAAAAWPAAAPGRPKGGTQRLSPAELGIAQSMPSSPQRAPGTVGTVGTVRGRSGAAAVQAAGGVAQAQSALDGASGSLPPLFGGPPAMPRERASETSGDLTPPPPSQGPAVGDEDSIVIGDVGQPDRAGRGEAARLRAELDAALASVEQVQVVYDREVADSKRLRAEIATQKERLEELRRALSERDDVIEAHARVSDELREEIRQAKDALAASRQEAAEISDHVAARERQLARSHEDIGQLRRELEDKDRHLSELSRTKDEGWRKLNEQLTEIEHLREVITQQERMLEERRVGLISQDEIIKELRGEKEQHLRQTAALKAERDELRSDIGRLKAQVSAIDEENRRLTGLLTDLRRKHGGAPGEEDHAAAAHTAATSAELKTLRIALKTVESERDHLKQLSDRVQEEVERLRERVAALEVDLRDAHDDRERASAGRSVSDDAMARAELARAKAEEEAIAASRSREEALRSADEMKRELDKARRRARELEENTQASDVPAEALQDQIRKLDHQLAEAGDRANAAEAELRTARAELEAARRTSRRGEATAPPPGIADGEERTAVVKSSANPAAIKDRAIDVHDSINDVLSALRNNAMILHDEFQRDGSARMDEPTRIIIREAIEAVLGHAEEAKGVLRRLRELVEFGDE